MIKKKMCYDLFNNLDAVQKKLLNGCLEFFYNIFFFN